MFLHRNTHEAIKEKRCHFCGWERPLRLKLWRLDYCPDNHNPTCTISNYGFCFNELMHLTTVPSFTTARLWVQILYHETEEVLFVNVSLFRNFFFHSNYSMTHSFFLSRLLTFYNFFKKMGQTWPLFVHFRFFHTTRIAQISVSKRRWCAWDSNPGSRIVDTVESTELWRHPYFFQLLLSLLHELQKYQKVWCQVFSFIIRSILQKHFI